MSLPQCRLWKLTLFRPAPTCAHMQPALCSKHTGIYCCSHLLNNSVIRALTETAKDLRGALSSASWWGGRDVSFLIHIGSFSWKFVFKNLLTWAINLSFIIWLQIILKGTVPCEKLVMFLIRKKIDPILSRFKASKRCWSWMTQMNGSVVIT